eukprot:15393802-Alexandrium_andersonii.AAC.1
MPCKDMLPEPLGDCLALLMMAHGLNLRKQQAPTGSLPQPMRLPRDGHPRTCATRTLPGSASWSHQSCNLLATESWSMLCQGAR